MDDDIPKQAAGQQSSEQRTYPPSNRRPTCRRQGDLAKRLRIQAESELLSSTRGSLVRVLTDKPTNWASFNLLAVEKILSVRYLGVLKQTASEHRAVTAIFNIGILIAIFLIKENLSKVSIIRRPICPLRASPHQHTVRAFVYGWRIRKRIHEVFQAIGVSVRNAVSHRFHARAASSGFRPNLHGESEKRASCARHLARTCCL